MIPGPNQPNRDWREGRELDKEKTRKFRVHTFSVLPELSSCSFEKNRKNQEPINAKIKNIENTTGTIQIIACNAGVFWRARLQV